MKDHGHPVARELDVKLPGVGSCLPSQSCRLQRVLRRMERITAMGHHDRIGFVATSAGRGSGLSQVCPVAGY